MRRSGPYLVIFAISLLFSGCGDADRPGSKAPAQLAQRDRAAGNGNQAAAPAVERKIIYTSQIDVVVEDFSGAQQKLNTIIDAVQQQGGYLARQEVTGTTGYHRHGSWTVRVPLGQFDQFIGNVERLGELERSSRDAQDVTEAYADLEARLRNKQASEQRLLSHLEKSAELKDTLELERELSRVRGEIEQIQGQLNVLKNKTDLATVTITLIERLNYQPETKATFGTQITRTFGKSIELLQTCAQGFILAVVALAPWTIVALIAVLPIVWVARRNRSRNFFIN